MTEPESNEAETPVEAPVPEAPAVPDEDVRISRGLAEIARRERSSREQMAAFEAERGTLTAAKQRAEEYDALLAQIETDPSAVLSLLEKKGKTFQHLVDHVIQKDTPEAKLENLQKEFRDYKQSQDDKITAAQASATQAQQEQAIADYTKQQHAFVEQNADDYPLINAIGGHKLLYQLADAHYKETGQILSHKDAADALEKTYFDNLSKLKTHDKVAAKLGFVASKEKLSQTTLTAGKTSGAAPSATSTRKVWTADEAREAALAKIKGRTP